MVSVCLAEDRPVAGDRLTLKDPPAKPDSRSVKFKASRDFAVDPTTGGDPRVVGATLEIMGGNPGDGNSGPVPLPAGLWTGLGKPEGSKGYRFKDALRTDGIKTVMIKASTRGGTLSIAGGKSAWAYAITQPQGTIDVRRLTIGPDVYCARFSTFDQNEAGKVRAKLAPAPADCRDRRRPSAATASSTVPRNATTVTPMTAMAARRRASSRTRPPSARACRPRRGRRSVRCSSRAGSRGRST
jgi:hypothetical protein